MGLFRPRPEELHRLVLELQATNGVKHRFALLTEIAKGAADKDCEKLRHVRSRCLIRIRHNKIDLPKTDFGKTEIKMRVKTSPLFEIARVLVRFNHVAGILAASEPDNFLFEIGLSFAFRDE